MKALIRPLALWISLAGACWLFQEPGSPSALGILWGILRLVAPAVAVVLTFLAVSGLRGGRIRRWSFWAITLAGWLTLGLLLQGRLENGLHEEDRQILRLAMACAGGAALWLLWSERRLPSRAVLRDMGAGFACLAILAGGAGWKYATDTAAARERAEARWREIGMPLEALEQSLTPQQETAGSQAVRQAFRDILSQRFYKEGTAAANREPVAPRSEAAWELVSHATNVLAATRDPADAPKLPDRPTAALVPHAGELDLACENILAAVPAVWACNPADGPSIDVPNFLGLRMFSQLATAESLRRVSTGDLDGAARAVAACKRMTEGLRNGPTLVSLMIQVAIDAMLAPMEARLEIAGSDWDSLQRDVVEQRKAFLRVSQWESWAILRASRESLSRMGPDSYPRLCQSLPRWVDPLADRFLFERQRCNAALNGAERAALWMSPEISKWPDFGAAQDDAISAKNPTIYGFAATRATMRMHATLLLREQALIIREARRNLAAGEPVLSRNSLVLPDVKWEVELDSAQSCVAMRMANAPKWIADNVVTGPQDFWLLPIDGSKSWQLARGPEQTAAANAPGETETD